MSLVQSAGLVNSQNSHFSNPGFSSKVGAVSGCGGTNSDLALQQKGLYQVVKTGGKRKNNSRKSRRGKGRKMRGGVGYGFSQNQSLAYKSGVDMGGSIHRGDITAYDNNGINSDTNMNASKQAGQTGGNSSGYSYGTGGYPYYSYKPTEGENLSTFAGSGYPPISRGLNSQCGGKRRKGSKKRKLSNKRGGSKKRKTYKKGTSSKKRGTKKGKTMKKQRGGYSQYMSNVANAHNYSTGAPPSLSANQSALANPTPFTPSNDCLNTWKHLGDSAPYNVVYK